MVQIDDTQFGFVAVKGTTDAIFIVRQLQKNINIREKYLANNQDGFCQLRESF